MMDDHKQKRLILSPGEVAPSVTVSNYFSPKPDRNTWGPRVISDFELIYIGSGFFSLNQEGGEYVAGKGDVLCIMPGVKHVFRQLESSGKEGLISCIHLELLPGKHYLDGDYRPETMPMMITSVLNDRDIPLLFAKAAELFNRDSGRYTGELLALTVKELWLRLAEYWENGGIILRSRRTEKMLEYIEQNLFSDISRQSLAREFGVTPEYVNTIFRRELNTTPVTYIRRRRIAKAHYYLSQEGRSIKETAMLTGYHDEYYFARVFKKVSGVTPGRVAGRRKAER